MKHFLFEERDYRIKPVFRRARQNAEERRGMEYLRRLLRGKRHRGGGSGVVDKRQRCTVKAGYSKSLGAHKEQLKYLAREGTSRDGGAAELYGTNMDVYKENMAGKNYRIIVSPESKDVPLGALAKSFIERLETQTGYKFYWLAAEHYNTEHPHVHFVINGLDRNGRDVKFGRDIIRNFLRDTARDRCTALVGARGIGEVSAERDKAVTANRWTELDKAVEAMLSKRGGGDIFEMRGIKGGYMKVRKRLEYLRGLGLCNRCTEGYKMKGNWREELQNIGRYNSYLDARRFAAAGKGVKMYTGDMGKVKGDVMKVYRCDEVSDNHAVVVRSMAGETYFVPLYKKPEVKAGDNISLMGRVGQKGRLTPVIYVNGGGVGVQKDWRSGRL